MHAILDAAADFFVPTLIAAAILVAMVIKAVVTIFVNGSRERSRREIAAYVAEGSITPEDAQRLLGAKVENDAGPESV